MPNLPYIMNTEQPEEDLTAKKQRQLAERTKVKQQLMGGDGVRQTAEQAYKTPSERVAAGEQITARDIIESNNRGLDRRQDAANDFVAQRLSVNQKPGLTMQSWVQQQDKLSS